MKETLLNDGFLIGNISNIFSNEKIHEIKKQRDLVLNFYENNQNLLMSRFTMNPKHYNFDKFPHDYIQDIPISEINQRYDLIRENDFEISQKWQWFNMEGEYEKTNRFFKSITKDIFDYYYPNREIDYENTSEQFTVLEKNDFIEMHMDGYVDNRVCVILIYLSDEYGYGGGGDLEVESGNKWYSVKPVFGNFVVLDFLKNNLTHKVNPVLNDFKRFCYTSFINQI